MLSYQHGFHAGNHADVIKHITVSLILQSLLKKETPFCYLDTHSGSGLYDLHAPASLKHGEFQHGIARLWNMRNAPTELTPYLQAINALNKQNQLRFYPGSPMLAQHLMRKQDRLVLCELHPTEVKKLTAHFTRAKNVYIHHQNGYAGLKAFLPPPEKRGLVLIDPAFELPDEMERFTHALITAAMRFPTGVIAGWFPMLDKTTPAHIERTLRDSALRNILRIELLVEAPRQHHFYGSTMIVINPPWQLDDTMKKIAPWLMSKLSADGQGQLNVEWVVAE
jgi:23S rRNA (adenine2030-N6)-methyltransferase